MSKEPKQVLEQDRVTTSVWAEECRAEVPICQKHGNGTSKNGQRQKQQECGDQYGPGKQWHLVQCHAGRPHVENGRNEVNRSKNGRGTGYVKRKDGKIHRGTGLSGRRQWRINGPATTNTKGTWRRWHEHGNCQQDKCRWQQPERNVVHARERHIRRADHDGNHPVGKTTDERRHNHEEDHDEAVTCGEHIVHVFTGIDGCIALNAIDHLRQTVENLNTWFSEFPTHHDRQESAKYASKDRKDQIQRSDIFVVGGKNPSADEALRFVIFMCFMCDCISHDLCSWS